MVQVLLAPLVISGSISREIDGVAQAGRADLTLTLTLPLTLTLTLTLPLALTRRSTRR